jgi:mono/diheme cytochrome c family protein
MKFGHVLAATLAAAMLAATMVAGCESKTERNAHAATSHPGMDDTHYAGRGYAGDPVRGKLVFNTNCATCHGASGRAGGVGPSLIDENKRQDLQRTIVWIENPDPPMPQLYPSPISEREVEDVAAFVQTIR